MWAPMATFFMTSPALFILLNIVIVIIVFISRLSSSHTNNNSNNNNNNNNHVTPLARALDRVKSNLDFSFSNYNFTPSNHTQTDFYNHTPSLIQRLKSINFSFQNFSHHHPPEEDHVVSVSPHPDNHPPQPAQLPSILDRVKSIDFTSFLDSVNPASSSEAEHPESQGSDPVQLKTTKSDQGKVTRRNKGKMMKSASEVFRRDDGEEELERRRPATVKAEKKKSETGDVDAKADDFINRFKQQLKLQRLDSLLRYKEMLNPK